MRKTKGVFAGLGELHYVNAPLLFEQQDTSERRMRSEKGLNTNVNQGTRCWWTTTSDPATMVYTGLETSLKYIDSVFEAEGPFDGVIGFAQGGTMAAILAALVEAQSPLVPHVNLKFVVCISSFYCRDVRHFSLHLDSLPTGAFHSPETVTPRKHPIKLPSFHSWGVKDELVLPWRSEMLSKAFEKPAIHPHSSDHFARAISRWPIKTLSDWLLSLSHAQAERPELNNKVDTQPQHGFYAKWTATWNRVRHLTCVDQPIMLCPVGLHHNSVLKKSFAVRMQACPPIYQKFDFTRCEVAAFVKECLVEFSYSDSIVDDLLAVAWCIYPYAQFVPHSSTIWRQVKKYDLEKGEVFYWFLWEVLASSFSQSKFEQLLDQQLQCICQRGQWNDLIRLDLLILTNSSLRTTNQPSEQKSRLELFNDPQIRTAHGRIVECFASQLFSDYNTVVQLTKTDQINLHSDAVQIRLEMVSQNLQFPGNCAKFAPRRQTYVERQTKLASDIAAELRKLNPNLLSSHFPRLGPMDAYQQVLRSVCNFVSQCSAASISKSRAEEKKISSSSYGAQTFEELSESPLSDAVLNPAPEPVEISTPEELAPLHSFFLGGQKPSLHGDLSFTKGTLCSDGRLDLCKQVIGPRGISDLINSLAADNANHKLVQHILLGNNIAGDNLGLAIANFINSGSSALTTWYIAGNRLTAAGIEPLCKALANDRQVLQLWLKRNPLRFEGANLLAGLLRKNCHLQVLDLTTTAMQDDGAGVLMQALKTNMAVKYLYLDGNGITNAGAAHVKEYLLATQNDKDRLVGLSLGCNRLGCRGAALIAAGLAHHSSLTRVCLASCGIASAGAQALASALKTNSVLRWLDIGYLMMTAALKEVPNRIGDQGAIALADALRSNSTLIALDVVRNNIHQLGMKALEGALCETADFRPSCLMLLLNLQQFGVPVNELTLEALTFQIRKNKTTAAAQEEWVREALHPKHLDDIASVYRVGAKYQADKVQ